MKRLMILVAVCAAVVCCAAGLSATAVPAAQQFSAFKARYNKTYPGAAAEAMRFATFARNLERSEQMARMNPLATFGVNEFADLTAEEFKATHHNASGLFSALLAKRPTVGAMFSTGDLAATASAVDWRAKGAVTYVKNQMNCGGCYAFSTTGNIEGQWFLAGNTLTALSEQEIISCDTLDSGCGGGTMDNAMTWLVQNQAGKIATEASYPFVSQSGSAPACALPKTTGAVITGHVDLPQSEDQMAAWMSTKGPLSIAVDATSFQTYTGGILTSCISVQLDHAVLAVGFDNAHSPPYWIVKNSWGATWGEAGYIRVAKGTNQCLINQAPSSSVVGGAGSGSSSAESAASSSSSSW